MANLIFDQGLQQSICRFFGIEAGTFVALTGIGVDDGTGAFVVGTTALNGTNVHSKAFEITPTRVAQTVTSQVLFATADAIFTHKRIALNYAAQPDIATPIPSAYGGIDSGSSVGIVKSTAFSFRYILTHTFTNAGTGNSLTVNQGLQALADLTFGIGSLTKAASMGFDDGASAYVAGDTTFQGATAATSIAFDATPTRAVQTVTYIATIPKGTAGNSMNAKTIKRLNINNQASTVAQTASAISGLYAGVSGQTIRKELDYSLKFTGTFVTTSA